MKFWSTATKHLSKSSKVEPAPDLSALMSEVHSLLTAEEYAKAREILLKAVELRDEITDAATVDWFLGALEATWLFQNQFEEQVEFFTRYLEKYPGDGAAHRVRGAAFWYSDRLQDALNDYSRALELSPVDILARSGRGQILAEIGENAIAIKDLDVALRTLETTARPNDSWVQWCRHAEAFARRGRGVALAGLGHLPEAMNEFAKSIALNPDNAWVYASRAKICDSHGNQQGALADYGAAMTKNNPPLTPIQKERIKTRIAELSRG
jgi:tetratricopeptide (TPR) repeat protein